MNQSVAVRQSVTLSWNISYTAQESSQARNILFNRYPQHDSSAVVRIGIVALASFSSVPGKLFPVIDSPFEPRIVVPKSASVTEPAITIQDVTKQDEAFYRIEVRVGTTPVANHTIFLTVYGNYVHFTVLCL